MYLNQFESTSQVRLQQVLATLKDVHGVHIKIDLGSPTAEFAIKECQTAWESTRNTIVSESSFNSYQQNPQYTKAMLILEAMKIMLTEIGPKRRRKLKMNESTTEEAMEGKPTISTQLAAISAKIPQTTKAATAFSNALSSIADKLSSKGTPFASGVSELTPDEKDIMLWIKGLPRPINVTNMVNDGIKQFGQNLLTKRMAHVASMPKVDTDEALSIMTAKPSKTASPGMDNVHEQLNESDTLGHQVLNTPNMPGNATFSQAHHYEYQASMARSELYRNAKYAMSMLKQVDPNAEIQPWIAACLTKSANMLDKVYHYLDYYKKFEPDQLPEDIDGDVELGETSGSVTRENLMLIVEYSTKLFNLIQPGDKLEGWVAMKLTTASECISSSKHYMDYVQFEQHALDDHFTEARRAKRHSIAESQLAEDIDPNSEELAKATLILNAKTMSGKVQDMAEDTAKLGVNELMPLVDSMRTQFGVDAASGFNDTVKAALDNLLNVTTETKETIDAAITTLQGGGVPAAKSDIEQAGSPEAPPDDTDISADMAALGPKNTGEEPVEPEAALGRAKKPVSEGKMTCNECGVGTYMEAANGKMRCNECGATMQVMQEAWGTEMHTAKKDMGKWEGYTLAELKAKKAKLMKKEERSAAEQQTVRQLNFAIRAKQKDSWGKIKEQQVSETWPGYKKNMANQKAKPSDADKKWEKITKIYSDAPVVENTVEEVAPPGKKAEEFIRDQKSAFKKRYGKNWERVLYATAWKEFGPKKEGYSQAVAALSEAKQVFNALSDNMVAHKAVFKKMIAEGKTTDPLNVGYGLEGETIRQQMIAAQKKITEQTSVVRQIMQEGVIGMLKSIEMLNKAKDLTTVKNQTPYGIIYETRSGRKAKKMFENAATRSYWLDLHGSKISNIRMVEPETFDAAINKKLKA